MLQSMPYGCTGSALCLLFFQIQISRGQERPHCSIPQTTTILSFTNSLVIAASPAARWYLPMEGAARPPLSGACWSTWFLILGFLFPQANLLNVCQIRINTEHFTINGSAVIIKRILNSIFIVKRTVQPTQDSLYFDQFNSYSDCLITGLKFCYIMEP